MRPKKIRRASKAKDMDRLSSLPQNVIEAILKCLPTRDAVRTSILSRTWRDELCSVPQLVFDRKTFPLSEGQEQRDYESKIVRIVDQVLVLHHGPITKFELSVDLTSCPDIDRWIRHLSRRVLHKLTLDIWKGSHYKLPYSFFLFKGITRLKLHRCILNPPTSFNGFSRLTGLTLQDVTISNDELGRLLSLSSLLKKLVLRSIDCTTLKINNQKLVELTIDGRRMNLYLESAPLLAMASISYWCSADPIVEDGVMPNIVNILGNLPSIKKLALLEDTLEPLSFGDIPLRLPVLCPLRNLSININFGNAQELLAAFCIFRSSFVLEELNIAVVVAGASADDFWEAQEDFNCKFNHLQAVELTAFTGTTSELKLVGFILANAPLLEKVRIEFDKSASGEAKILRQMLSFRRSSDKAQIIVAEKADCLS